MTLEELLRSRQERVVAQCALSGEKVQSYIISHWHELRQELKSFSYDRVASKLRNLYPSLESSIEELLSDFISWVRVREAEWVAAALPDDLFWILSTLEAKGQNAAKQQLVLDTLRAPTKEEAAQIIYAPQAGLSWTARLERWSKKITDKDQLAKQLEIGVRKGETEEQLQKRILPFVSRIQSSAARIVRNECMRISNQLQERTFEQFSNIIEAFKINGVLDTRIRPAHLKRHGTIYKKGQKRPDLPDEPNCRCWYTPVFKGQADLDKLKATWQKNQTADPTTRAGREFRKWFNEVATPSQKKGVIGKATYDRLSKSGEVTWKSFVDSRSSKPPPVKVPPRSRNGGASRTKSSRNKPRRKK